MGYFRIEPGVYIITNLVNEKHYVGESISVRERLMNHKNMLILNTHDNEHLQNAWNLYGAENFLFDILEFCKEEHLKSIEHYWCYWLNTHDDRFGYNIALTDHEGKRKHSEETKRKLSEKNKGKIISDEAKEKIRQANLGKKQSKETIEKRLKSMEGKFGHPISKEHKEVLRNWHLGRKQSLETIEKRSKALKGRKHTEEWKRNMSIIMTGREGTRKGTSSATIHQLDLQDNFIKEWFSLTELCKETGFSISDVSKCTNGKKESCRGFKFKKIKINKNEN